MKKFLAVLLALAMVFSMAACGSKEEPAPTGGDSTEVVANPDYPNNGTINCVIGWSAGGTTDLVAREVTSIMSSVLGCNNNCTNVTGASGSIAAAQVQAEGLDGETAWGGMISAIGTWRAMGYNDYDWQNWHCFVSAQADYVLAVAKNSAINTIEDFIAAANAKELSAGNPGLGSVGHLAAVAMNDAYGVKTNHVPYAGGRAAAIGVMGGEIDYVFIAYGDVSDLIKSGDLKPIVWTGEGTKTVELSTGGTAEIPSMNDEHPEVNETIGLLAMWGVAVPRDIPEEQLLAFSAAWEEAVNSDEFKTFCEESGIKPVAIGGEDADKTMANSMEIYVQLLKDQGIVQ